MAGKPVGTIFAELALDTSSYTKSQREILASASQTALNVERNWRIIGEKSDVMYDAMRQRIENAYQRIAHSATATHQEIVRAKQAAADKIKQIDEQQYGHQTSLLDSMKKNYLASAAVIAGAWMAVNKAMAWAELGAKAMQAEESFRIVAASAGESADKIVESMKRVSAGTVDDSDIMQKAVKGMTLGLNGDQLIKIMEAARVSARVAGEDVRTAYESITDAIATGMPKALKKYGLITKEEMAVVNAALKAGVDNVDLYTIAMMNAGIQSVKMGDLHRNAAEDLQAFHAQVNDIKESVGKAVIAVGKYLLAGLNGIAAFIVRAAAGMATILSVIPGSVGRAGKEAYAILAGVNADLMKDRAALLGVKTEAEKKEAAAAASGAAARIAALEAEKKAFIDGIKAQVEALKNSKDSAKETERLNASIVESTRKATAEIEGIGKTHFEQEKARIDSQVAAWGEAGANRILIEKWASVETAKARKEQGVIDMKAAMNEVKEKIAASAKFYSDQESALKEYNRIVTEAQDWSIDEHQRAINRIQSSEAQSVKTLQEMYDNGFISIAQLFAGINAARDASNAATAAQISRQMSAEVAFYSQLADFADAYYAKNLELIEKERQANALLYGEKAAQAKAELDMRDAAAKKWDMEHAGIKSMIGYTDDLLDSTMSMFKRESSEYRALMKLKEIAHVAEMGMNVAKAASALTVAMTQNAANASTAMTGAASSVAAQGSVPIAGFGLAAAMAAFMASILAASGISWGGGSGSTSAPVLPASTVLGAEAGTGSESASKGWELLEDLYSLEYRELTGIHDSMKELNRNITGLVTSIVRTGGVGNIGSIPGSTTSSFESFVGNYAKAYTNIFTLGLLGGLGTKIGGFVGSVIGSIFGGGSTSSQTAGGIQFGGSSVSGLLAGGGMSARQYAEITTTTDGGWFHGDSTSVEMRYQALDAQVSDMLDMVFRNLSSSLVEMAKGLGVDTQAALDYVFSETKINLQGKTTEEINKAISEFISNTGDTAVEALFGEMLRGYQQLSEGLFETAVRLLRDKAVILDMLSMTNQAFAGTTAEAIAFSEAIIAIAGDLDALTKAASTYYDKFFTDTEKQARLQSQLTAALADMGMTLPSARDGYRALVEGLDLTTDAGKEAYVALLNLAEGADTFYSAAEDALKNAQDKYLSAQKAYLDEQVQVWGAQLKAQETLVSGLRTRVEDVTKWISSMNRSSTAAVGSAQAWQAEYVRLKGMASGSGASNQSVSDFLGYAKEYLSFQQRFTGGNYREIYDLVMGDVKSIGDLAAEQIPAAEMQLSAIQAADQAAREAAAALLGATQETNATLLSIARENLIQAGGTPDLPAHASGGLTNGPTISGEAGREWNVPTYEPQRSRFLRDVGADPDAIGRAVAKHIGGTSGLGGGKDIHVHLHLDGKEITGTVVRGIRGGDSELIRGIRKAVA